MPKIEVCDVRVLYGRGKRTVSALDGFNAEFQSGINVIVGYSGCGKTTLLECMLGLRAYDGKILSDGVDLADIATKDRNFGYVSEGYTLFSGATVFDNIAFPLKVVGAEREEITNRVRAIAEKTGLTPCLSRNIKHISAGQQQKTAIARALIKHPSVCLLDEPLSNIDGSAKTELRHWMKKLFSETGCMAIYVTHDIREAMSLADRLYVMNEGKNVFSGNAEELLKSDNAVVKSLLEGTFRDGKPLYW